MARMKQKDINRKEGIFTKTKIEKLPQTLKSVGINVTMKEKDKGSYIIDIETGFQMIKHKSGVILNFDGLKILIKGYCPFLSIKENFTQVRAFLIPIQLPRA